DRVLRHCLEKKPEHRFESARDLAFALETLSTISASGAIPAPPANDRKRRRWIPIAIVTVVVVAALAAVSVRFLRVEPEPRWSGVLLGGPEIAMTPRISPDGKVLAFLAMVDNQTQVAVMDPENGNWRVLTRDRAKGTILSLAWSADSSRIYF